MFIKVINQTRKTILVNNGQVAQTFMSRAKGLLGKKCLQEDSGLLIKPCKQIHSVGMRFIFDAVFIDKNYTVCHLHPEMQPGQISKHIKEASYVLELPAGKIRETGTCIGDLIKIL